MTALRSQGCILKLGDGADPEVFTAIGELVSINGVGSGSSTEIDVTNLSSTAKQFLLGLKDEGEVSLGLNLDTGDTQQIALRTARDNAVLKNFELDLTDTAPSTLSFSAYVKTFAITIAVDEKIGLETSLRISGAVAWA